jgi:hypothetical protein
MVDQNFKLNEQNSLLRRLTGNGVADLNELNNDLERYKQMLEMFDEIIKEQVSLKTWKLHSKLTLGGRNEREHGRSGQAAGN